MPRAHDRSGIDRVRSLNSGETHVAIPGNGFAPVFSALERRPAMITAAHRKLKGHVVRFLLRDVHYPEPDAIVHELHDGEQLRGKVLDFCDLESLDGSPFVIVRVAQLRDPCLVSIDRLLRRKRAPVES